MQINCYLNKEFPIIATASRDNLEEFSDKEIRYPLIHACLKNVSILDKITGNEKELLCVYFNIIRSHNNSDELILEIRNELIKFISDTFENDFIFYDEEQFFKCSDMSDTMIKSKYFLLSLNYEKRNN